MPTDLIFGRLKRALLLDEAAFVEVRDDNTFTPYSAAIAAAAIILGAIGSFLWAEVIAESTNDWFVENFIIGSILLLILWIGGVAATYLLLTQVFGQTDINVDGLFRVMTLGHAPFALSLLVFIPAFGYGFALLAVALMFFYTAFGVRSAYPGVDPLNGMLSVLGGFAVWALLTPFIMTSDNPWGPGVFVYDWTEDVIEDVAGLGATSEDLNSGIQDEISDACRGTLEEQGLSEDEIDEICGEP